MPCERKEPTIHGGPKFTYRAIACLFLVVARGSQLIMWWVGWWVALWSIFELYMEWVPIIFCRPELTLRLWSSSSKFLNQKHLKGEQWKQQAMKCWWCIFPYPHRISKFWEIPTPQKFHNPLKETFDFFRPLNLMPNFPNKNTISQQKFRVGELQELGDVHGTVPLHLAALRGHLEVVQTLVLAGRRWDGKGWEVGEAAVGILLKERATKKFEAFFKFPY